jgi:hypothetical protein
VGPLLRTTEDGSSTFPAIPGSTSMVPSGLAARCPYQNSVPIEEVNVQVRGLQTGEQ